MIADCTTVAPATTGTCWPLNADDLRAKWHRIDPVALQAIANGSSAPGLVYPVGTNALPRQIQSMHGVVSYFISSYSLPATLQNGMTAGAEIAVVRTEGSIAKAYNYLVATSNNGMVYFNGPHKDFPLHHHVSTAPVSVESLFGHVGLMSKVASNSVT